jgi:SulP family sulfate permease
VRLQEVVRLDDGGWEIHEAPQTLESNRVTVLVVQGLDFFAEVPVLEDQMPAAGEANNAVVILILRDVHNLTSTAIRWLERYVKELQDHESTLMLADVNPEVMKVLKASGALDVIGEENVFPATTRILEAEITSWKAAQAIIAGRNQET